MVLLADRAEYPEEKQDLKLETRVARSGELARAIRVSLRDTVPINAPRIFRSTRSLSHARVCFLSERRALYAGPSFRELRPPLRVKRGTPGDYPARVLRNFRFRVKRTVVRVAVHRSGPHLAAGLFSAASFFSLAASRR